MIKLDIEQKVLLNLIMVSLSQQEINFPDNVDWDKVYELAKEQQIVALAEPAVPDEYKEKWLHGVLQYASRFVQVLYGQDELVKLFHENAVPIVIIKGTAAAMYYPNPERRGMGDVDFLVRKEDLADARNLMEKSGYKFIKENDRHCEFEKDDVEFELHWKIGFRYDKDIDRVVLNGQLETAEYSIKNSKFPGLPTYKNGLVLLGHIMHHLKNQGIGLRQIIDWMMFVHVELNDELWENEFKALAQEAGLEKLAITITYMCKKWLGLPDEITWCNDADEDLADAILRRIFIDGNFGHERPVTDGMQAEIRKKGLFPYLQFAGMTNWKLAQKYRILRPFAWLYQVFRFIRKGIADLFGERTLLRSKGALMSLEEIWKRLE